MTDLVQRITPIVYKQGDLTPYVYADNGSFIPLASIIVGLTSETRFVAKTGNDATGDGSISNPFLTIQAAITSVTDESASKPYTIMVLPGTYTSAFLLEPWIYVVGWSQENTVISPIQANWISAAFAVGTKDAGIANVTIGSLLTVDFNAVLSAGAASIQLSQITMLGSAGIVVRGRNVSNTFQFQDIQITGSLSDLVIDNITGSLANVALNSNNLTISATDAYGAFVIGGGVSTSGIISVTWTGTVTANFLYVRLDGTTPFITSTGSPSYQAYIQISGRAAILHAPGATQAFTMPDADTTVSMSILNPVGATSLISDGTILATASPTADRTLTFGPAGAGTRFQLKNLSAFNIFIAYAAPVTGVRNPVVIPPNGMLDGFCEFGGNASRWVFDVTTVGVEAQTRYVSKGGSDSGDGSYANPFLTIAAALTSITDASSAKVYQIKVGPGTYATAFTLKAWVYVVGAGQQFTIITQANANWVDASFAAGSQEAGLTNLALSAAVVFDFSLVAATGAAYIKLNQISLKSGSLTIKGNAAANGYVIQDLIVDALATPPVTITNIGNGFIDGVSLLLSAFTVQSTDAYSCISRISNFTTAGTIAITWTGAVTANFLVVAWWDPGQATSVQITITGIAAQLSGAHIYKSVTLADANATLSFGDIPVTAGAVMGVSGGNHDYTITPTAARALAIENGGNTGARLRIKNNGTFPVTLSATGATPPTFLGPTIIPPKGTWYAFYNAATTTWSVNSQGLQAQTRYVSKEGVDTGSGAVDSPFLTIQAAITSITDATQAKPYVVAVLPGVYATTFRIAPNIYVVGAGAGPGNYNAAPLNSATVVAPDAAQSLSAGWAGAGTSAGGIINCGFSTAFNADFLAIASTGAKSILLKNITTDSAITVKGSGSQEYACLQDVIVNNTVNVIYNNLGGSETSGLMSDFGGALNILHSGAFPSFHQIEGSYTGGLNITWTAASIVNTALVNVTGKVSTAQPVLTGAGAILVADQTFIATMSDAANRLSFGNDAAATIVGISQGTNIIKCTPTANRVLTITRPQLDGSTQIIIKNLSTAFYITLTLSGGTIAAGSPTYVPPLGEVIINHTFPGDIWYVLPYVQSGVVTLVSGVSALIPADVSNNTRVTALLKTWNGDTTGSTIAALGADRVTGTFVGGGGFKLKTINAVDGGVNSNDNGTYDWEVSNS